MILKYYQYCPILYQLFSIIGNFQGPLKVYHRLPQPSHGSWWYLHPLHLHTDLVYWYHRNVFYNHVMLSSNLLLYRPQPWFFQRLPHGLSHPFYMWLLLRFSESKPMRDPVMEVPRAQRRCGDTEYVSNPKRSSYLITDLKPKPICICVLYLP